MQIMDSYEERQNKSAEIQENMVKIVKKCVKEVTRKPGLPANETPDLTALQSEDTSPFMYEGQNLLKLGGDGNVEKGHRLAAFLFSKEELRHCVIDASREQRVNDHRVAADKLRSQLFEDAMKVLMGPNTTDREYKTVLRLVNQKGLYKPKGQKD